MFAQKPALQMGDIARACLLPGTTGRVLAVFSRAVYLLTDAGELLWLTGEHEPLHRRCVQIGAPLPAPEPGSSFQVQAGWLLLAGDVSLDLRQADCWHAPLPTSSLAVDLKALPLRVSSFFSGLDLPGASGFGLFIPGILGLMQGGPRQERLETQDPALRFAQARVMDMAAASLDGPPSKLAECADALVGLGAGLTPSGDDFLGGLLFARKMLSRTLPDGVFQELELPLETYRARTPLISFTLLADLAAGHAIAPLHQIFNGLLDESTPESLAPCAAQLTAVGHSTGWDLLTGLLTGLLGVNSMTPREPAFIFEGIMAP